MTQFSIAFKAYTPTKATAIVPPDGRLLAEVIRWVDLRDIKITGLGTSQVEITVEGDKACVVLEGAFARWFPYAPVVRQWEAGAE